MVMAEDSGQPDPLPEMFSLPKVVLAQPKGALLGGRGIPKMILYAADGTEFAALHDVTPRGAKPRFTLADPAGRAALTVAIGPSASMRTRFVFTDGQGRPAGGAEVRNVLFPALGLRVRSDDSADVLHLARTALAGSVWLVKDDTDAELVRVTASSAAPISRRQRYEVGFDRLLTPEQRRAMVGAVISLQAVRRGLSSAGPV
jgi:hypothetical protein